MLSPSYHLVNTGMHADDSDFALDKGLFLDNYESAAFKKSHHRGREDFLEFAVRIGIEKKRARKLLEPFLSKQEKADQLIKRSFLNDATKRANALHYSSKLNARRRYNL